ncbi:profilin-1 [Leuresthes tenuis]|uniref:profilin-1 n=1 Tax=Leuresthes tenuis TaxID=355514 RepID=UPI003B5101EF
MSWDSYVDLLMTNPESVIAEVAICGSTVGEESVWARKGLDNLKVNDIKALISSRTDFPLKGVEIAGQRYRMLRDELDIEGRNLLHLKSAADADGHSYGMCVGKTIKTIIIALGKKDVGNGQLATPVFKMVEYLRKLNS